MKKLTGSSALIALLLSTTAVCAEVTAEEVWQGIAGYYTDLGQTVSTGSQEMQGDTFVITDAVFKNEVPEGGFQASVAEIRLKELGDGRVEMTMSEEVPVTVTTKPETGEAVDMAMNVTHSGFAMIVSGSADDTVYDYTAPEMGFSMDGVKVDDAEVPLKLNATLSGNSGSYRMTSADGRKVTSDLAAEKLDFAVTAKDPEGKGTFSASGSLTGLSGTSDVTIPAGVDMTNMHDALQAGVAMDGNFAYTGGGYVMDFADENDNMHAQSTGGGGTLHFAMSADGMSYGGTGKDAKIAVQVSSFPLPIDLSMAESAFNFAMPVAKSDEAQPFGLLVKFVGLEVSEGLWGMFDPAAQLPRDPATLIVDLSGAAKLLVNILDPKEADAMGAQPPGELNALDINELKLSAVGAELTGNGALTFDNTAGIPKPLGAVDLQLNGANALIDKLVAMGFVPEDQAMGARMMMGLFAVPTGEDALSSKIEFKEDGGVYANGQRVQ
ncbi:MAG: DUF2125 domain-containing protein [Albidovulum sp.]|uniref:DUF2125 domain-containing protein n=1 Tax=Albidovulum sp. TaxID=1872424 RepID=UPI003CBB6883